MARVNKWFLFLFVIYTILLKLKQILWNNGMLVTIEAARNGLALFCWLFRYFLMAPSSSQRRRFWTTIILPPVYCRRIRNVWSLLLHFLLPVMQNINCGEPLQLPRELSLCVHLNGRKQVACNWNYFQHLVCCLLQLLRYRHHQIRFSCTTLHYWRLAHAPSLDLHLLAAWWAIHAPLHPWIRHVSFRHSLVQRDRSHSMVRLKRKHKSSDRTARR